MDRFKGTLTYANITATVALFVALGGSSYAALKLPKNSVGDQQIRASAVRSSEVLDRSLGVRDLSTAARSSLRGAAGAAGPVGPQGPPGAPAAKYFAVVQPSGAFVRGNATSGGKAGGIGTYSVSFATPVAGCAYSATLATTDGGAAPAVRVTVSDAQGAVGVQTYDAAGAPVDAGFHLVVAC